MSKVVSVFLVLLLFFGPAVNSFADGMDEDTLMTVVIVGGVIIIGGLLVWWVVETVASLFSEADTPDNGIILASEEDEVPRVTTDGKTVLNVLKHVEAGVTPNKDIYVGLRFQY